MKFLALGQLLQSILILIYSLSMRVLTPLLTLASHFVPKLKAQLKDRKCAAELAQVLVRPRAHKRYGVIFYCSSAGEYEQARPLIDRLVKRGDTFVHVFFFSQSGISYARARGETASYSLVPATDSAWAWGQLFSALRPDIVAVVRHELWPAFLETARHFARLDLIDASQSIGEASSGLKRFARQQLLRYFDTIFTVTEQDAVFFQTTYALPADKVIVAGDTKYDRVLERARAQSSQGRHLSDAFGGDSRCRLVLGSAHKADAELWLDSWQQLGDEAKGWQVVIAPHHIDGEMTSWLLKRCQAQGLRTALYSRINRVQPQSPTSSLDQQPQVIIVDAMGLLAEIYGISAMAFVGGAMHHQVHNVLEPACHGLALAFGPFYKNSQEAVHLVQSGLAEVCDNNATFVNWWRLHRNRHESARQRLTEAVTALCGASEVIMSAWNKRLTEGGS